MPLRVLPLVALLFFTVAAPATAHPLTDVRFDHAAAVRVSAEGIRVTYTLELSPLALYLDSAKRLSVDEIAKLDKTAHGLASAYAKQVTVELTEKFRVRVDGDLLPLKVAAIDVTMSDHVACRFTLLAPWPAGGKERALTVEDDTFADQPGVVNLTLDRKGGKEEKLELNDVDEPPIGVRTQHSEKLKAEQIALSRQASATVVLSFALAPLPHAARKQP